MRYFDRHRRFSFKKQYVRGVLNTSQGESTAEINESAGLPLKSLTVKGKSVQGRYVGEIKEHVEIFGHTEKEPGSVYGGYSSVIKSKAPISLPEGVSEARVLLEEKSSLVNLLPDYATLMLVNEDLTERVNLYTNNTVIEQEVRGTVYLAAASEIGDGREEEFYQAFINNARLLVKYQGESSVPTPDTPIEIKNTSDNATLVLEGENLFDSELLMADSNFTKAKYEGFDCIKIQPRYSAHMFPCYIPRGSFSVSFDYIGVSTGQVSFAVFAVLEDGTYKYVGEKGSTAEPAYTFRLFKQTKSFEKDACAIELRFYNVGTLKEYYFKNIMVNIGEAKEYQPYFKKEIELPKSLSLGGTEVSFSLSSVTLTSSKNETKTATDCLTVDGQAKKVFYHKAVNKIALTSKNAKWVRYQTGLGTVLFYTSTDIGAGNKWLPILANKYPGYSGVNLLSSVDYGITTDALWWSGSWKCALTIKDTRFDTIEDFKADIDKNPLELACALSEPLTYDITNTELGRELLNLTLPLGISGKIKIESEIGASGLSLEYYSWAENEKKELTVSYLDSEGNTILAPKKYSVRKGSLYKIMPPHIDGYTPLSEGESGILNESSEVNLIYKEK